MSQVSSWAETREKWEHAGQGHVFDGFEGLNEDQQTELMRQLRSMDVELVNRIYKQLRSREKSMPANVQPFPSVVHLNDMKNEDRDRWEHIGYNELAAGHVAVLTLAGGQGTRLGTDAPKGVYDVGLPSHRSLYQFQGERLTRLQKLVAHKLGTKHSVVIPWYVMTSFATDTPTREHFEQNHFFGLDPANVVFFNQDLFPCVFEDGEVIMEGRSTVSVAPNGNGGLWSALVTQGVLADMERRGITLVCSYPVDNILVKVADPAFVGFCVEKKADVACKVVAKAYPEERVGVLALKDNRPAVIEYSEIAEEQATARDPKTGKLLYNASHIVLNNFSIDFIRRLNMCALEVKREEEFSPLKNGDAADSDNPTTCRKHLSDLHRKWIEKAGGQVTPAADGSVIVEVAPEVSYDGEGLEELVKGKSFASPVYICKK